MYADHSLHDNNPFNSLVLIINITYNIERERRLRTKMFVGEKCGYPEYLSDFVCKKCGFEWQKYRSNSPATSDYCALCGEVNLAKFAVSTWKF